MHIKEILYFDEYTATLIITDGEFDLKCFWSVYHIPNTTLFPKIGMEVLKIFAKSFARLEIKLVEDNRNKACLIQENKKHSLGYLLIAKIIDKTKALVGIGNLIVTLENDFENGLPTNFENGDCVEFSVDRLDCSIEL